MVPPEGTLLTEDTYNWYMDNTCDARKHVTAVFCSNATKIYIDGTMVQQSSTGLYSSAPIFNLYPPYINKNTEFFFDMKIVIANFKIS